MHGHDYSREFRVLRSVFFSISTHLWTWQMVQHLVTSVRQTVDLTKDMSPPVRGSSTGTRVSPSSTGGRSRPLYQECTRRHKLGSVSAVCSSHNSGLTSAYCDLVSTGERTRSVWFRSEVSQLMLTLHMKIKP